MHVRSSFSKADYSALNGLARQRINIARIARDWDDLLRVAGSLKMGTVGATELVRGLQGGGHPSTLGRAIGELGRAASRLAKNRRNMGGSPLISNASPCCRCPQRPRPTMRRFDHKYATTYY
jgi:hypothetical protein